MIGPEKFKARSHVAAATLEEWKSMPESDQVNIIRAATVAACCFDGFLRRENPDEWIGEVWIAVADRLNRGYIMDVNSQREKAGKGPATLKRLIAMIARAAVSAGQYQRRKDRANTYDIAAAAAVDDTPRTACYMDLLPAPEPDEESPAILGWLESITDPIDQMIIRERLDGKKDPEIAAEIGMNKSTITRRRAKMQDAMIAAGFTRGYLKEGA